MVRVVIEVFCMVVQDLVWELLQCSNKEVRSISSAMLGPSTKSTCFREMLSRCKASPLRVETELLELVKIAMCLIYSEASILFFHKHRIYE